MCEVVRLIRVKILRTSSHVSDIANDTDTPNTEAMVFERRSSLAWLHTARDRLPKLRANSTIDTSLTLLPIPSKRPHTLLSHLHNLTTSTHSSRFSTHNSHSSSRPPLDRAYHSWTAAATSAATLDRDTIAARYDALRRESSFAEHAIAQKAAQHFSLQLQEARRCVEDAELTFAAPLAKLVYRAELAVREEEGRLLDAGSGKKRKVMLGGRKGAEEAREVERIREEELERCRVRREGVGKRWSEACQVQYSQHMTLMNVMEVAMEQLRGLEREVNRDDGSGREVGGGKLGVTDRTAYRQLSAYVNAMWCEEWRMRGVFEECGWLNPNWPNVVPKRSRAKAMQFEEECKGEAATRLTHEHLKKALERRESRRFGSMTADALLYSIGILPDPED